MRDTLRAMTVQAIPTRYAGYHFRSRLEARWAVFFDYLRIDWEYEPEGFVVVGGAYLPDFRISDRRFGQIFVEVKPSPSKCADWIKARTFHVHTNHSILFLAGAPRPIPHSLLLFDAGNRVKAPESFYDEWADRNKNRLINIAMVGFSRNGLIVEHADRNFRPDPSYLTAIDAARSARFEHGHSGAS